MNIPALDNDEDIEYKWHVGEPVALVSLWKVTPTYEFPIYQQTRGYAVFNSSEHESGNIDSVDPTPAFWTALRDVIDEETSEVDVEDCEWYESEFIGELLNVAALDEGGMLMEIGQLFAIALRRGDAE